MSIYLALDKCSIFERSSPVEELKSIKNLSELEGMRHCHIHDGAALVRFLAWLDHTMLNGSTYATISIHPVSMLMGFLLSHHRFSFCDLH